MRWLEGEQPCCVPGEAEPGRGENSEQVPVGDEDAVTSGVEDGRATRDHAIGPDSDIAQLFTGC